MSGEQSSRTCGFRAPGMKTALAWIVVSLIPLILLGGVLLQRIHKLSREAVETRLQEIVLLNKARIESFLEERLNDLRYLSRFNEMERQGADEALKKNLRGLQDAFGPVFTDLCLVDEMGHVTACAGIGDKEGANSGEAEWFRQALYAPDFTGGVLPGFQGESRFVAVVRSGDRDVPGLLLAGIDLKASSAWVEDLRVGRTEKVFILHGTGKFQTRPSEAASLLTPSQYLEWLSPDGDVPTRSQGSDARLHGDGRTQGSTVTIRKDPISGRKVVLAAAPIRDGDWLLVLQQDFDEAFETLNRTTVVAVVIFVLSVGAMAIAGGLMASRLGRRDHPEADFQKDMVNQQIIETGKLATIGELAAGIAHEINNPVAIMVEEAGWIQDLLEDGVNQEENLAEFHRALKQIQTQGRRCREISHKLLSFARKTDYGTEMLQINDLIAEVVHLTVQRAKYDNVEIRTVFEPDLPYLELSMTEMQQVLLNIIHNALDAMDRKGGLIEITTGVKKDHVAVAVRDTGPGIEPAHLGRVFDPFFTTKPVGKGTGLGLSICYGIVKKMGGHIEVESTPGKGALFRILLPLSRPAESTAGRQDGALP